MVAIFFLPAAGEDKVLKAEAAALHPIAGELNVVVPVRRLRVGVQADNAGKIARVFLCQRRRVHLRAGGKGLPGQQGHVLLGNGKAGVIQQQLLLFFELFRIEYFGAHRGQRLGGALGSVEDQRAKYLYVQDHLDEVRAVFAPLGYSVLLYPAPLQAAALVNGHEGSQARLLKYESILLLVLRLLYLQKRESLAVNADEVLVTVEEVQTELQKMNLPRRLDQKTLENLMRTLRRYNLARPVGRLTGLDSRIEVFPTVLLALPDADLADAAAESGRTRAELDLYERPDEAGEGEE